MSTEAYSVAEVASILGCAAEKATEQLEAGELPGLKFGRGWIIPVDAFRLRLNEIALEEAQKRRKLRDATTASGKTIERAQGPLRKGRKAARTPPPLQSPA